MYKVKLRGKALIKWRDMFLDNLRRVPKNSGISLSGGMDSSAILYGLVDLKKKPKYCITFHLEGHKSSDVYWAKKVCEYFNIPLIIAKISKVSKTKLYKEVKEIVRELQFSRSIDVQCCWAYSYMLPLMKSKNIVIGFYTTLHFTSSTNSLINYRRYKKGEITLSEFKKIYNKTRDIYGLKTHNYHIISEFLRRRKLKVFLPLYDKALANYSKKFTFMDFHEDYKGNFWQKYFMYKMFKDYFDAIGNWKNIKNFHVEGGIKEYHTNVLTKNTNYKRIVGIYNTMLREVEADNYSFRLR